MQFPTGHQLKKEIISNIPELGYRNLSVKYDGSYQIYLKKLIPLSRIKKVTQKYVCEDRCSFTGELLFGGNTFVFFRIFYCSF